MVVFSIVLTTFFLLAEHVPLDVHGEAEDVDAAVRSAMLTERVAAEEPISDRVRPLLVVVQRVDAAADQVLVELRLVWVEGLAFELVDRRR